MLPAVSYRPQNLSPLHSTFPSASQLQERLSIRKTTKMHHAVVLGATASLFLAFVFASPPSTLSAAKNILGNTTNPAANEAISIRQGRLPPCGENCSFKLCNFDFTIKELPLASFVIFNGPQISNLPFICASGVSVGRVLASGEASVFTNSEFEKISAWRPSGLTRRFFSDFITTAPIPFFPNSGIARQATRGNQWDFLHDRCMILPVLRYQTLDPDTRLVQGTTDVSGQPNNCVAFRTTAPAIHVQLVWDAKDDFDLELTEPDGDKLNFRNPRTERGKLNGDNNVKTCEPGLLAGRENIVYFPAPDIEIGRYVVTITHFSRCSMDPVGWRLRVMKNGVVSSTEFGLSDAAPRTVVATFSFAYP